MNATSILRVQWERDRLFVPVPWKQEEALRMHLAAHGVESTAHLDPTVREACLELHSADAEMVQTLLDHWEK